MYRTIPLHDILHNKTRAIDTLLRFFIAEPEFNVNSKTFTSGKPKPNEVQNLTLNKLNKFRKEGKTKGLVCYATGLGKLTYQHLMLKILVAKLFLLFIEMKF